MGFVASTATCTRPLVAHHGGGGEKDSCRRACGDGSPASALAYAIQRAKLTSARSARFRFRCDAEAQEHNVAGTVSVTGAATEAVHSGGGCSSGWGPLVKLREHPGAAATMSVAGKTRTPRSPPSHEPVPALLRQSRSIGAETRWPPGLPGQRRTGSVAKLRHHSSTGVAMKPCQTLFGSTESKLRPATWPRLLMP
jgi:hypothetical protein